MTARDAKGRFVRRPDEAEVLWLMAWGGARDRATARAWLADDPDIIDKIGRFMVPGDAVNGRGATGGDYLDDRAAGAPMWMIVASGLLLLAAVIIWAPR